MNQAQSEMSTSSKKRVTISQRATVVETLSLYDYSAREIAASWYDDEEMDRITQRCFIVLKRMECGTENGQKYCTRGLEGHAAVASISKKKNRSTAVAAVLDEQARQWHEETMDVQSISDAYRRTTSSCQMWAHVVGNRDQKDVEAFLYEDEEKDEEIDAIATISSVKSSSSHRGHSQAAANTTASAAGLLNQSCARAA
ncbi:MAG: hypothetical protein SGBAC_005566 [Bacillariaceae sp.]